MVFLISAIGVLNVCLGYGLAVYLGHGPPGVLEAWEALTTGAPAAEQRTAVEELMDGLVEQQVAPQGEEPVEQPEEAKSQEEPDAEEAAGPEEPQYWDLDEKFVEASVLKFKLALMKDAANSAKIDTRLRKCRNRNKQETIRACADRLRKSCEVYLAEQAEAADQFRARFHELGEMSALGKDVETAVLDRTAQVENTLSNLGQMDFKSDLETAGARLLEEIDKLRTAGHRLGDYWDKAFLAIARHEDRLGKIESRLLSDALCGLPNRIGLEKILWDWWQEDRHLTREIGTALFDLDQFGGINERYGSLVGDRILHRLARLIPRVGGKESLVARFGGGSFLVVMPDVGPRAATKTAELIRQSIKKTTFLRDEDEICLTATGAVTEVTPEDDVPGLLERLEKTLRQAKQSGPNRSFFHDGSVCEPVESPNLGAKEREIGI